MQLFTHRAHARSLRLARLASLAICAGRGSPMSLTTSTQRVLVLKPLRRIGPPFAPRAATRPARGHTLRVRPGGRSRARPRSGRVRRVRP
jgi:hypothetical protein